MKKKPEKKVSSFTVECRKVYDDFVHVLVKFHVRLWHLRHKGYWSQQTGQIVSAALAISVRGDSKVPSMNQMMMRNLWRYKCQNKYFPVFNFGNATDPPFPAPLQLNSLWISELIR